LKKETRRLFSARSASSTTPAESGARKERFAVVACVDGSGGDCYKERAWHHENRRARDNVSRAVSKNVERFLLTDFSSSAIIK